MTSENRTQHKGHPTLLSSGPGRKRPTFPLHTPRALGFQHLQGSWCPEEGMWHLESPTPGDPVPSPQTEKQAQG